MAGLTQILNRKMEALIKSLGLAKDNSLVKIEETLLAIPDFSNDYWLIKKIGCDSYAELAERIHKQLN